MTSPLRFIVNESSTTGSGPSERASPVSTLTSVRTGALSVLPCLEPTRLIAWQELRLAADPYHRVSSATMLRISSTLGRYDGIIGSRPKRRLRGPVGAGPRFRLVRPSAGHPGSKTGRGELAGAATRYLFKDAGVDEVHDLSSAVAGEPGDLGDRYCRYGLGSGSYLADGRGEQGAIWRFKRPRGQPPEQVVGSS